MLTHYRQGSVCHTYIVSSCVASVVERLRSLASTHLPLTAADSISTVDLFQLRQLPDWLDEGMWFYPGARPCLKY